MPSRLPSLKPALKRKAWQHTGPDKRLRGRAGQAQRQRRLARTSGLCEACDAEGLVTLATVVNHKLPLARGGADTDENTENLCDRHDAIVTAQQFGKAQPVEPKGVGWALRCPTRWRASAS